MQAAKQTAIKKLRSKTIGNQLRRWWVQKYKLPWTHEIAQNLSYFEILVEFYEDYYEEDKSALYKEVADEDGHVILPETGDELIDKWEKELAQGLTPDLEEGMTPEARKMAADEKEQALKKKLYSKVIGDGFDDRFVPNEVEILGRKPRKSENNKLLEIAKRGDLSNMDPATLHRLLDSISPEQAQQIISILKNK